MIPVRHIQFPNLKHFKPSEFGIWAPHMSEQFLIMLDELRERAGHPIMISPAPGAIGRDYGSRTSQHYWDGNHLLAVADVMPYKVKGEARVPLTDEEMNYLYHLAREVGFGGIGIYPKWQPFPGVHLDNRSVPRISTWSAFPHPEKPGEQEYFAIDEAFTRYYT